MKETYKLLKWYPSLPKDWEIGMIVGKGDKIRQKDYAPCSSNYFEMWILGDQVENQKEYWAPYLFTTEDGKDIYKQDVYYAVNPINKDIRAYCCIYNLPETYKCFSSKEAAQKYIDKYGHQEKLKELQKRFPVGSTVRLIDDAGMNAKHGNLATVKKCYFDEGNGYWKGGYMLDVEWDRSTGTTQHDGGYYAKDFEPIETKSITIVVDGVVTSTTFDGDSCEIKYI